MSDAQAIGRRSNVTDWASSDSQRRIRKRYGADRRLQAFGILAIALAMGLLGILLASLIINGYPAFVQTKVDLSVAVDPSKVDPKEPGQGNFKALIRDAVVKFGPEGASDKTVSDRTKILSSDATYILRDYVLSHPDTIGKTVTLPIPASDPFDQLYKGVIPKEVDALNWSQMRWFERLQNRNVVVDQAGNLGLKLDVYIDPAKVQAGTPPTGDFPALARDSLQTYLPDVHDTALFTMLAPDAPNAIAAAVSADPSSDRQDGTGRLPCVAAFHRVCQRRDAKGSQHTVFAGPDGHLRRHDRQRHRAHAIQLGPVL